MYRELEEINWELWMMSVSRPSFYDAELEQKRASRRSKLVKCKAYLENKMYNGDVVPAPCN